MPLNTHNNIVVHMNVQVYRDKLRITYLQNTKTTKQSTVITHDKPKSNVAHTGGTERLPDDPFLCVIFIF